MNILITAGGTSEKIDNVRNISNVSTGKLGSIIAGCFAAHSAVKRIFYICDKDAVLPQSDKTEIIHVDSVLSLENTVKDLFASVDIDVIVHSMAVSDYRVKTVTSAALLAYLLQKNLSTILRLDPQEAGAAIAALVKQSEPVIKSSGKISSHIEDMILLMERTPKIISLFRTLAPKSILVGFKLLIDVPVETLIDKGYQLLTQNKCDFVLANDLKDIYDEQHIGYLINKEKNYTRYANKTEIAGAIVAAVIGETGWKP